MANDGWRVSVKRLESSRKHNLLRQLRLAVASLTTLVVISLVLEQNHLFPPDNLSRYVLLSQLVNDHITGRVLPPSRRLDRDTFFRKAAPADVVHAYFAANVTTIEALQHVTLHQLWNCSQSSRKNGPKLAYVHLPRCAGITVRTILRAYAELCHASIAVVSHCGDLGFEYLDASGPWSNGRFSARATQECVLNHAATSQGVQISNATMSTELLMLHDMDILAGHAPMGSNAYWLDSKEQPQKVVFLVFMRDPLTKFISQFSSKRRLKMEPVDAVMQVIRDTVSTELQHEHYHEIYSNGFITPAQKEWAFREGIVWTVQQRLNLTLHNLAREHVIVGLVERPDDSYDLIQYALDANSDLNMIFAYFKDVDNVERVTQLAASQNHTRGVLERIQADAKLSVLLRRYLHYETQVYEFAKAIHVRQVQLLRQQRALV